jgi:hypothetical protein
MGLDSGLGLAGGVGRKEDIAISENRIVMALAGSAGSPGGVGELCVKMGTVASEMAG